MTQYADAGRSPLRGAWIEIRSSSVMWSSRTVAPPCGERGLKSYRFYPSHCLAWSLPLAGSVD